MGVSVLNAYSPQRLDIGSPGQNDVLGVAAPDIGRHLRPRSSYPASTISPYVTAPASHKSTLLAATNTAPASHKSALLPATIHRPRQHRVHLTGGDGPDEAGHHPDEAGPKRATILLKPATIHRPRQHHVHLTGGDGRATIRTES